MNIVETVDANYFDAPGYAVWTVVASRGEACEVLTSSSFRELVGFTAHKKIDKWEIHLIQHGRAYAERADLAKFNRKVRARVQKLQKTGS
jgi:hypothetical protein